MEEWRIVCKIAEMRSYIASDWPCIEERKSLYKAVSELELELKRIREDAENTKRQKDKET
jgi:hypothetical protein